MNPRKYIPPTRNIGFKVVIEDLFCKPSPRGKYILKNVSLTVEPGEILMVVGGNAAGKSSLLRAISGELMNVKGTITIGNQEIDRPVNQVIDGVGIVHQFEEYDLIDNLTIAQNIAIRQLLGGGHNLRIFSVTKKWERDIRSKIARYIEYNTPDVNKLVKGLCGGEKQSLAVAIAIHFEHVNNPCGLLLLDEHTSKLDHNNLDRVMRFTIGEVKSHKITAIIVTHRYPDAIKYADRILVMKDGGTKRIIPQSEIKSLTPDMLAKIVDQEEVS